MERDGMRCSQVSRARSIFALRSYNSTMVRCLDCSFENPRGFRFCLECGADIPPSVREPEARRFSEARAGGVVSTDFCTLAREPGSRKRRPATVFEVDDGGTKLLAFLNATAAD